MRRDLPSMEAYQAPSPKKKNAGSRGSRNIPALMMGPWDTNAAPANAWHAMEGFHSFLVSSTTL